MLIILKKDASANDIKRIENKITDQGLNPVLVDSAENKLFIISGDTRYADSGIFTADNAVIGVKRLDVPYALASRKSHPESSIIDVSGVKFGCGEEIFIAGPCAVESEDQLFTIASAVKASGARILRAGAFKPRTSPYAFQGLGREGLAIIGRVKKALNMPVASEITDISELDMFSDIDLIQVGARNMQNYELLKQLSVCGKPVLLKRGAGATVDEWLNSAEYLLCGGNKNVILCERGIRTFETHTRNTLDIAVVPLVKKLTHLPIIIDPSHSAGAADLIMPVSLAATAAGSDGIIIEVHNDPQNAKSDGAQAVCCEEFDRIIKAARKIEAVL